MVDMTATIDGAASAAFNTAFKEFAASLGGGIASAPRRAAISVCKAFRAATRQAPQYARGSEYIATKSDADPKHKYLTLKDGRVLRRWNLKRPPRGTDYDVYAESKSDLRKNSLKLVRRGLARQSWGWVMHNIFNGAAPDTPWQRRKRDRRDPKYTARESYSTEQRSAISPYGVARISNRLDYISDALKISVDDVLMKAANKLIRPIINARLRAGGMSPDEIKTAGHAAHEEWKRQFDTP